MIASADNGNDTAQPVNFDAVDALVTDSQLLVDLDGFEGPIDVLLALARDQKVDLTKISILQLADQYLAFVARAQRVRLELAADYLVMAAWLAYLKSRLLLPEPEANDEQPSGQEMAAALAFQLRRLESMQDAGARLFARSLLGRDVFARGAPEPVDVVSEIHYETKLYDLLRAYGNIRNKTDAAAPLEIAQAELYSVEVALDRLREHLGRMPDWQTLVSFLPAGLKDSLVMRSALAATFVATLELVREGKLMLRQSGHYQEIFVRQYDEKLSSQVAEPIEQPGESVEAGEAMPDQAEAEGAAESEDIEQAADEGSEAESAESQPSVSKQEDKPE
ncbi:MAG TPA: ScpA family protein [Alphaproteobacteria bacterium]|jgi:segregation and condensation protein A